MWVASAILCSLIVLVIWQPRGLGVGWSASPGAVLALAFGVVQFMFDIPGGRLSGTPLASVALIIISLLLDEAGFSRGGAACGALGAGPWQAAVRLYGATRRAGLGAVWLSMARR